MDAQNTVCANCPFVKANLCSKVEECPNYCENIWRNGQTQEVKIVKDCAPKRQLMMQQQQTTSIQWLQQSVESLRNRQEALEGVLNALISESRTVIKAIENNMSKDPLKIDCQEVVDESGI